MGLRDRIKKRVRSALGAGGEQAPPPVVSSKGGRFPEAPAEDGMVGLLWDHEVGYERVVPTTFPGEVAGVVMQHKMGVSALADPGGLARAKLVDGRLVGADGSWDPFTGEGDGVPDVQPWVVRSREAVVWIGGPAAGDEVLDGIVVHPGELPRIERTQAGWPPARLLVRDLELGSGEPASSGETIGVHYVGQCWSTGRTFDSSFKRKEVYMAQLGVGKLVAGWEEGLLGMRVGGKRVLVVPPWLAYGEEGVDEIVLPGEWLLFYVERLR